MKPNTTTRPWSVNAPPSEPVSWKAPIVRRGQRTAGRRVLYAHGGVRQPISPLGTGPDIGTAVWSSEFQPEQVTLHDWMFNDALFESGYPGFNLALSFKVPKLPENPSGGPGYNMRMRSPDIRVKIQRLGRATSQVNVSG